MNVHKDYNMAQRVNRPANNIIVSDRYMFQSVTLSGLGPIVIIVPLRLALQSGLKPITLRTFITFRVKCYYTVCVLWLAD